jgi:hypothetical protein
MDRRSPQWVPQQVVLTTIQRVADLEAENESLREQLADKDRYILALEDRMQELEARLKRYENTNTPPSRHGGDAPVSDSSDDEDDDGDESRMRPMPTATHHLGVIPDTRGRPVY